MNDNINWGAVCKHQKLSEGFIRLLISEFKDNIIWNYICINQKLSEDFIRDFKDDVCWSYICSFQDLSEEFMEEKEIKKRLHWGLVSKHQKLSEEFMWKNLRKLNLETIVVHQKLSEDFIHKLVYNNYILENGFVKLLKHQKVSNEFALALVCGKGNWINKTKEEKLLFIKEHTCYELIDDEYIIAYKSCRSDGYSCFNFMYKYEVGRVYESTCDCNDYRDSFGLSAWSLEGALRYCKERMMKVKINVEDIGIIIQNNDNKIRCYKLEVLEVINI